MVGGQITGKITSLGRVLGHRMVVLLYIATTTDNPSLLADDKFRSITIHI